MPRRLIIILLAVTVLTVSGCEPLRKKFIRKKKDDAEPEVIAVLDPVDYPTQVKDPSKEYKYHYSMWQVWHRDLMTVFNEGGSDKRVVYLLNQLVEQMDEMQQWLSGPKQERLQQYEQDLRALVEQMSMPAALRNDDGLQRKVAWIGKQMRTEYRLRMVKESLVK